MQYLGTNVVPTASVGTNTYTSATALTNTNDTITGSVFVSAAGTLHVEQSPDGTNWDIDDTVAVAASTANIKINLPLLLPYLRLRFVLTAGNFAGSETIRIHGRLASSGVKP